MSNKQLSRLILKKLAQRKDYFAWYLWQYQQNENLSSTNIADLLQASTDQIEILSMCKVPDSRQPDFPKRLKTVADLAGINHFPLAMLIRKVEATTALQEENKTEPTHLIAAREKNNSTSDSSNEK